MPSGELLKERGNRILEQADARRVGFLIEIHLGDDELHELFQNLRKVEFFATEPATRACLALAAVHAANQAGPGDSSFISLFFTRLGRPRDDRLWDEVYGPAIERCLHEVFQDSPRTGPYRFVGAVYRHSGVPIHGIASFASLLQRLTTRNGYQFTRHEYDACCEATVTGLASEFLRSDVGYEYALDSVRVLQQIRSGLIPDTTVVPGYPQGFWDDVLGRLQPAPAPSRRAGRIAMPKLAIDLDTWAFGVRVPPSAIRNGVVCSFRRLTSEWNPIRSGKEVYTISSATWRLPWSPSEDEPAVFSASDGSFVASSDFVTIPPGEYILVQQWDLLPSEEIIKEDIGYCDWSGNPPLRAWRIQVPVGYRGANLAAADDTVPSLLFGPGYRDHAFGSTVFLDSLPDLVVHDWSPEAERLFAICLEDEAGTTVLCSPDAEGHVKVSVTCPVEGVIRLIPRGRSRMPVDNLPRLPFTVIPSAIRIRGPRQLTPINSECAISAELPDGWSLKWDHLTESAPNRWIVPPKTWVIDGDLSCRGISVRVSWRVPRIAVHLRTRYDVRNVIWRDGFDMDAAIDIQAPPHTTFTLRLRSPNSEAILQELDPVPVNGILTIRCVALRDALNGQVAPAVELRLATDSGPFGTEVYWVNGVSALVAGLARPESQCFMEAIPEIGPCLATIGSMARNALQLCSLVSGLKDTPLRGFISDCAVLAESIDGTCVDVSKCETLQHASEAVVNLATWYRHATHAATRPGDAGCARDAFPGGVEVVPFPRWRDAVTALLDRLQDLSNLPSLISEWRKEVRRHGVGSPVSLVRQRPRGEALTQGAVKYLRSFDTSSEGLRSLELQTAAKLVREAEDSPEELVHALATALWWLIIYRVGIRPTNRQLSLAAWLAPAERTLSRVLGFSGEKAEESGGGLRLCEISPADQDEELEVS